MIRTTWPTALTWWATRSAASRANCCSPGAPVAPLVRPTWPRWTTTRAMRILLWGPDGMGSSGCSDHLGVAGGVGGRKSDTAIEQKPPGTVDVDRPGPAGAAGLDPELANGATQGHAVQPLPRVEVVRQLR